MPVNYQQALQQIREMGSQAPKEQERLNELRALAANLFTQWARELDTLEQLVERATAENPTLRCAAPYQEFLDQSFSEPPIEEEYTLLAADGSQINPDRHGMVEFGAINVGAIRIQPGKGSPPREMVQSQMMFHNDLFTTSGNPLTDELVALKRDLAERKVLATLAKEEKGLTAALTDGPLELFREPKGVPEFKDEMDRYQEVLHQLADLDVATAGYVDKPRGDLTVRLLELVILEKAGRLNMAGKERPLRGVYDFNLFLPVLNPGERSAIFAIRAGQGQGFQGRLALHFFYLNTGREDHPNLSRVEVPRWVADSQRLTNLIHACLLAQSRHLGASPYPYILHRAHEVAVVSFEERDQLEKMIVAELRRQGVEIESWSNKQIAKKASANHSTASHKRSR